MLKTALLVSLPVCLALLASQFVTIEISPDVKNNIPTCLANLAPYLKEIIIGLVGFVVVMKAIMSLVYARRKKEKNPLNYTKKIPREYYDSFKKKYTEDTIKEFMESFEFKRYMNVKQNNGLKEIELTDSDNIVLSDDSSILGEDEKVTNRQ